MLEKIEEKENDETADFETAISATKFGKFNYLLILCVIPASLIPGTDNSVMSYVVPVAQCELNLTVGQKGALNSSVFVGYLFGSCLWGFLGDTLGRRKILFLANTLDLVINFVGAFMQNFWLLLVFRFLAGFIVSGPYGLLMAYISEFHSFEYRSIVVMFTGACIMSSLVIAPLIAWVMMPLPPLVLPFYVLYPWQQYLLVSTIPVFLATILFKFLPESPKYLMVIGQNDEALQIFKKIYSWNTGNSVDDYPIKQLKNELSYLAPESLNIESDNLKKSSYQTMIILLNQRLSQGKSLFLQPNLLKILLYVIIHFCILAGANSLRVWLPQLFTSIDEYNKIHGNKNGTLCDVIEFSYNKNISVLNENLDVECVPVYPNDVVYFKSMIVSLTSVATNILMIFFISHFPRKYIIGFMCIGGGITDISLYWTPNQIITLIVSCINQGLVLVSSIVLLGLVVETFPTTLRGLATSLTIMAGQCGAFLGTIILSYLLQEGCFAPFLFIGILTIFCGLMALFLPIPSKKDF